MASLQSNNAYIENGEQTCVGTSIYFLLNGTSKFNEEKSIKLQELYEKNEKIRKQNATSKDDCETAMNAIKKTINGNCKGRFTAHSKFTSYDDKVTGSNGDDDATNVIEREKWDAVFNDMSGIDNFIMLVDLDIDGQEFTTYHTTFVSGTGVHDIILPDVVSFSNYGDAMSEAFDEFENWYPTGYVSVTENVKKQKQSANVIDSIDLTED